MSPGETKRLSASETKRRLGEVISNVANGGAEIIVENHGQPRAAIIPIGAYEQFQRLREQERRAKVLEEIQAIGERARQRNQDLTPEQAEELADRFMREVISERAAVGKIRFETGE